MVGAVVSLVYCLARDLFSSFFFSSSVLLSLLDFFSFLLLLDLWSIFPLFVSVKPIKQITLSFVNFSVVFQLTKLRYLVCRCLIFSKWKRISLRLLNDQQANLKN